MARTATAKQKEATDQDVTDVYFLTHPLGSDNDPTSLGVDEVDARCQKILDQGYRLDFVKSTYITSQQGPGGVKVDSPQWHLHYTFTKDSESANLKNQAIHHMIRGFSEVADPATGTLDSEQLMAVCKIWLDQGYKIKFEFPEHIGTVQGPGGITVSGKVQWHILFIFLKED